MSEVLEEEERQLLVVLVTRAWVGLRDDPEQQHAVDECESILRKIGAPNIRVICERAPA